VRVCVFVTASDSTPWAAVSVPNTADYCVRHGYSLVLRHMSYAEALTCQNEIIELLGRHDLLWTIDADCLITNHKTRIETVPGLGPHVTVCEEGMWWYPQNRINCGSMVWRSTDNSRTILREMLAAAPEWSNRNRYPNISQSWLADKAERYADSLTILPPRAFNSVAWQQEGGGTLWEPGDLVYHPCCHPHERRAEILRAKLQEVVR
jgi:hypothetical protein